MKTTLKILFLLATMTAFIMGCSSNDDVKDMIDDDISQNDDDVPNDNDPDDDGEGQQNVTLVLEEITIQLPDGVAIDLSKTQLTSFGESYEVGQNGATKAQIPKDGRSFAYLTDNGDNVILMGFISKENPVLNIVSTLESSLYFGFGTVFQLPEVKSKFLDEFKTLPEIQPYVTELETMYKSDPLLLKSGSFHSWVNTVAKDLTNQKEIIDVNKSVFVSDGDIKSGIMVAQDDSDTFSAAVRNFWRRRARAFFYKTHIKKEGASDYEEILDPKNIAASDSKANVEFEVAAVTGLTSIQGNTWDIAIGNGLNLGFTTNGPGKLELLNDQSASKYTARIVGPGRLKGHNKTAYEKSALTKMNVETLLLDFVIPTVTTVIGGADIVDSKKDWLDINPAVEAFNVVLASTPTALDALDNGDFKTATVEIIKSLALNFTGTETFMSIMIEGYKKIGFEDFVSPEDLKSKMAAPLTIANAVMTGSDFIRIIDAVYSAKDMETFELVVSRGKVRIDPPVAGVSAGNEVTFKAKVIDDEDVQQNEYTYEWTTSEKFGNFRNDSDTDEIIYRSKKDPQLPIDAKDNIYVSVFKDGNLVGKDSSVVNIYLEEFHIRPNGITIQGDNSLRLNIVDVENNSIIFDSEMGYYRVVWNTAGTYGSFEGSRKTVESINSSSVVYQAFDTEVERGAEIITAKIYYAVYTDRSDESLNQEIKATINIENDELVDIFYVDKEVIDELWAGGPGRSITSAYGFAPKTYPDKDVVSYTLRIVEQDPDPLGCAGKGKTWLPANAEADLAQYGRYVYGCGSTQLTDPDAIANTLAYNATVRGYAMVTVQLKNKE